MKKEITPTVLRKKLAELEKVQLEKIIFDLYEICDSASESINMILLNDKYKEKLLNQYIVKLNRIFDFDKVMRHGFSLENANKVIKDFENNCQDERLGAELKLHFSALGAELTTTFGAMNEKFYETIAQAFYDAVEYISDDEKLYNKVKLKINQIIENSSDIGWGFSDVIFEAYSIIPWGHDDE